MGRSDAVTEVSVLVRAASMNSESVGHFISTARLPAASAVAGGSNSAVDAHICALLREGFSCLGRRKATAGPAAAAAAVASHVSAASFDDSEAEKRGKRRRNRNLLVAADNGEGG